jgi:NAD(P)-dependent dehydrogenase (short-subunit alcohol dehydrogenase family)
MSDTYLITGASRGLGREFVAQLSRQGHRVLATVRRETDATRVREIGARVIVLDVTDFAAVESLSGELAAESIDVLINNAGVSSEARNLALTTPDELERAFRVNTIAPVMVVKSALDALRRGRRRIVVNISSQLASITNNTGGSSYPYRASKCALNMLTTCMANEFRSEGFTFVAMHPGWVRTDMGGPKAPMLPHDSIDWMLRTIAALGPTDSGKFLSYDGTLLPW